MQAQEGELFINTISQRFQQFTSPKEPTEVNGAP